MEPISEVCVVSTEKIKRWIRTALASGILDDELKSKLRNFVVDDKQGTKTRRVIPFSLVKSVHECIQTDQGDLYLHELLQGSDVYLPQPDKPERNQELEARIQKLKAQQANREYNQMTRNINAEAKASEQLTGSMAQDVKSLNRHLVSVLNFLITVIGSFVFAYKAVEYSMEVPSFPMQLLSGLTVATIVFFADLYFLLKYDV